MKNPAFYGGAFVSIIRASLGGCFLCCFALVISNQFVYALDDDFILAADVPILTREDVNRKAGLAAIVFPRFIVVDRGDFSILELDAPFRIDFVPIAIGRLSEERDEIGISGKVFAVAEKVCHIDVNMLVVVCLKSHGFCLSLFGGFR